MREIELYIELPAQLLRRGVLPPPVEVVIKDKARSELQAVIAVHKVLGFELLQDFPTARALLQRLHENPHVQLIAAQKEAGMAALMAHLRSGA